MPEDLLLVRIGGEQVGRIARRGSLLCLTYDDEYSRRPDASPLSLSLPLADGEIEDRRVEGWLSGLLPTTHILKPSMRDLADQSVNEHLCLEAARHCGLPAVATEMAVIAGHPVLVVRRFDRIDVGGTLRRVHQEDLHQACGEPEVPLYQNDRGEGHSVQRLARLLADHSADRDVDLRVFFDALVFNWVMCNTDGHSKNYSLLLAGGRVRLAPLYDIWSMMPYDPHHYRSYSLAMSALSDRRIITAESKHAWEATARAVGLGASEGVERAEAIAQAAPEAVQRAVDELPSGLRILPVVQSLVTMSADRRRQCLAGLAGA
ncbi:HipA domain-containing protein [Candidatus Poriferisocius sp.]|uniref:HipA domain-containing protein n=1 Tax=Candidatus Poriferisocius sp. TaxID=3101276 RepID=UPI003B5C2819